MKKKLFFLILISFLSLPGLFAQDDDLPPTDDPDIPAAPINDYIPVLFAFGVLYAIWLIRRKQAADKI